VLVCENADACRIYCSLYPVDDVCSERDEAEADAKAAPGKRSSVLADVSIDSNAYATVEKSLPGSKGAAAAAAAGANGAGRAQGPKPPPPTVAPPAGIDKGKLATGAGAGDKNKPAAAATGYHSPSSSAPSDNDDDEDDRKASAKDAARKGKPLPAAPAAAAAAAAKKGAAALKAEPAESDTDDGTVNDQVALLADEKDHDTADEDDGGYSPVCQHLLSLISVRCVLHPVCIQILTCVASLRILDC